MKSYVWLLIGIILGAALVLFITNVLTSTSTMKSVSSSKTTSIEAIDSNPSVYLSKQVEITGTLQGGYELSGTNVNYTTYQLVDAQGYAVNVQLPDTQNRQYYTSHNYTLTGIVSQANTCVCTNWEGSVYTNDVSSCSCNLKVITFVNVTSATELS